MVAGQAPRRHTPAEYLALERRAEWKHEYIDGCIVAMSGASRHHNRITADVLITLGVQLRDGPCEVFPPDLRIKMPASDRYTYPDVVAVCSEPEFEDAELDTLLNPTLIVEVLSPSTEAYDRGDKFTAYRRIPSQQEYVLIAQDRPSVDHFLRQGDKWLLTPVTDLDGAITLPTIGCTLLLREIYRRVQFPSPVPDTPADRA